MKIFVGNLSWDATEDDLRQEFTAFGDVTSINIIYDKFSGKSRGFGFVEMPNLSEGQAAINGLNGKILADREMRVNGATERPDRGGRGSFDNRRGGSFDRGGGRKDRQRRY